MIVVGGGDTGMDCISNSHREGARSVVMLDVYAALPPTAAIPGIPGRCRRSARRRTYALEEGGKRRWGTEVTGFGGTRRAPSATCTRGRSPAPPRAT